jgi:hypothetical protein
LLQKGFGVNIEAFDPILTRRRRGLLQCRTRDLTLGIPFVRLQPGHNLQQCGDRRHD